jgi:hypothetical protein
MQQRTTQQNKALHKMFSIMAETLNNCGLDMRKTLKPEISISWSPQSIKEYLWRPVMRAQTGKRSTTEMTTKEVNDVYETISRHLAEKFGVDIPFPSIEEIRLQQEYENQRENN